MTIYDEILQEFPVLDEPSIYKIDTPFVVEDYIMATDGHIAIRVPRSLVEGEYFEFEKTPGMKIFNTPKLDKPVSLTLNFSKKEIKKCKKDSWTDCKCCRGKGVTRDSDGCVFPCICDCDNGKEFNLVIYYFDDRPFDKNYLIILQKIMEKLDLKSFDRISETPKDKQSIFRFGAVEVALMGVKDS